MTLNVEKRCGKLFLFDQKIVAFTGGHWHYTDEPCLFCLAHRTPKKKEEKSITDFSWLQSFHLESNGCSFERSMVLLSFRSSTVLCSLPFSFFPEQEFFSGIFEAFPLKKAETRQRMNNKKLDDEKKNTHQTDFPKKFIDTQHVTRRLWVSSSHPRTVYGRLGLFLLRSTGGNWGHIGADANAEMLQVCVGRDEKAFLLHQNIPERSVCLFMASHSAQKHKKNPNELLPKKILVGGENCVSSVSHVYIFFSSKFTPKIGSMYT